MNQMRTPRIFLPVCLFAGVAHVFFGCNPSRAVIQTAIAQTAAAAFTAAPEITPTPPPSASVAPTAEITTKPTSTAALWIAALGLTITPTAEPSHFEPNCLSWDQIDATYDGKSVCVYGIVTKAYSVYAGGISVNQFRIFFSDAPHAFFMVNDMFRYSDLKKGDCVTARGVVKLDAYKTPYLQLLAVGLYACSR
jgi:hypothetical protein